MSTEDTKAPASQSLSEADKQVAKHALRAILETLWRYSGSIETMARVVDGDDIDPPGLFNILRDSGRESFSVGADAIDRLEQILGIEVSMREGEDDPFAKAYADIKRAVFATTGGSKS